MGTRSSRARRVVAIVVLAGILLAAAVVWVVKDVLPGIGQSNPFANQTLYAYPESSAAVALRSASGADATAIAKIAATPSAIWLLPEVHPTAEITAFVDGIAARAESDDQLPVFVVYGIPNRDCQNESSGGLSSAEYPAWVTAIGDGLLNHNSIVILEPDALALAQECDNVDERVAQIRDAASRVVVANPLLSAPSPHVYIDGGHSNWGKAADMANLLKLAGVDSVQGFASNVSNFNKTAAEVRWDTEVSRLTGGAHFVIDTSRNGNGSNGNWCNPPGRALGEAPGTVSDGGGHDANLWIKNPGESDGLCNGGPAAGGWWNDGALALARN